MELFKTLMAFVVLGQILFVVVLGIMIKLNSHTMPKGRQDVSGTSS